MSSIIQPYPQNPTGLVHGLGAGGVSGPDSAQGAGGAQAAVPGGPQAGPLDQTTTQALGTQAVPVSGAAPLPDVAGAATSPADRADAAQAGSGWLALKPFHLEACLAQVAEITQDNAIQQGQLRRQAFQAQTSTQLQSAKQQVLEVQGERQSATTNFATSVAAAGVAVIPGVGQALSPVVTQTGNLIDTYAGGKWKSDEAKMAKAFLDQSADVYKSEADDLNQAQQQAQQALQNVLVDARKEMLNHVNETQRNITANI